MPIGQGPTVSPSCRSKGSPEIPYRALSSHTIDCSRPSIGLHWMMETFMAWALAIFMVAGVGKKTLALPKGMRHTVSSMSSTAPGQGSVNPCVKLSRERERERGGV